MKKKHKEAYWNAAGLGAMAGVRAFAALAFMSHSFQDNPAKALRKSTFFKYLQNPIVAKGLATLSAAEMVGDVVPGVPDRIELPSLLIRTASGAVVGATSAQARKGNLVVGALIGASAAVAATYGSFYLRKGLNKYLPNLVSGGLEDSLVLWVGTMLPKRKIAEVG